MTGIAGITRKFKTPQHDTERLCATKKDVLKTSFHQRKLRDSDSCAQWSCHLRLEHRDDKGVDPTTASKRRGLHATSKELSSFPALDAIGSGV